MSKMINGKRWPEDFPYRFFIGMHTVDYDQNKTIPNLLCDMDGRKIVRQIADTGVDAIYYYASCHAGNCFYPTEVVPGHMHSGLNGRDVFGEAADECQKLGIAFIGVYEFMHLRNVDFGPREWQHYYPQAGLGASTGLCWNTGYGEFVLKQIEEIARRYPMAGMYIDMVDYPGLVCCEGCARRFKDDVGVAPPRTKDVNSPLYKVFRLWGYKEEARFIREMRKVLQTYQPDATMVNNTHILKCEDLYETTDANDYLTNDTGVGMGSARGTVNLGTLMSIFRSLSRGKQPFEILSGQVAYGCMSVIPTETYNAISAMSHAQGAASGYPGSMLDQHGKLHKAALGLTKKSSAFAKARYPWKAEGESVRFAGLYLSQETQLFHASFDRLISTNKYMDEFHGAYLMLQQEHLSTDILTRRDLKRLSEYPVIYLPNTVCMSDEEVSAFREYVRTGGTLVASYRASLCDEWHESRGNFALSDVFGVDFISKAPESVYTAALGLLMPLPDGLFETEDWEDRVIPLPQSALICKPCSNAKELISLHERHGKDPDMVCSALNNVYLNIEPRGPAVIENKFGQGRCIYFSGKIFSAYLFTGISSLRKLATRWLIQDLINKKLLLKLDAPHSVEMTAFAQPAKNRILAHLVNFQSTAGRLHPPASNMQIIEHMNPVHDLTLKTTFSRADVIYAKLQPAGEILSITELAGNAVISIPKVHIHDIVEISLKQGVCPEYPDSNRVLDFTSCDLRKKVQDWLAGNPPEYDPDDDGTISFDKWRPAEDFLTDWNFIGPFDCNVTPESSPESNCELSTVYLGFKHKEIRWQELSGTDPHQDGFVEMTKLIGNIEGTVGYALCYLRSDKAQKVRFWVGNDDDCTVFVNSVKCFSEKGNNLRNVGADQTSFEVHLQAGNNVVLVKKTQIGHGMGFYLRIEQAKYSIICSATPDGTGREVTTTFAETKEWNGRGEMQI